MYTSLIVNFLGDSFEMTKRNPSQSELIDDQKSLNSRTDVDFTPFKFVGLRPNTKHDLYMNGIIYNWAAKPYGKNLGDSIISDNNGRVSIDVFHESAIIPNVEDSVNNGSFFNSSLTNQQKDNRDRIVIRAFTDFELISADQKSKGIVRLYTDLIRITQQSSTNSIING